MPVVLAICAIAANAMPELCVLLIVTVAAIILAGINAVAFVLFPKFGRHPRLGTVLPFSLVMSLFLRPSQVERKRPVTYR